MTWSPFQITRGNILSDIGALWFSPRPGNLVKKLLKSNFFNSMTVCPNLVSYFIYQVQGASQISYIHLVCICHDHVLLFPAFCDYFLHLVIRITKGPYIWVIRSHKERTNLDRFFIWLIFILFPHSKGKIPCELF